jgi:outer membrane PBP1 activator LpoA protein
MKSQSQAFICFEFATPLWVILFTGALVFSGCAPAPVKSAAANGGFPSSLPVQPDVSDEQPSAASQFLPILPPGEVEKHLLAIENLIHLGDNAAAKRRADVINPIDLTADLQAWLNLLHAQIFLGFGDAEMAVKWLAAIPIDQLDAAHKIEYLQSQAFAFSLAGDSLESAKFRIKLDNLLTSPKQRDENQAAILEALALLPESYAAEPGLSQEPELRGWIALAQLLKQKSQPEFSDLLSQWREQYPGHSANAALLQIDQDAKPIALGQATHIALFLPESGAFAEAAQAIRAGFMAAYNSQQAGGAKPAIRFYNTEQMSPDLLYKQAIAEGAGFIIGPLQKEVLQKLADSVIFDVPVLALNHIPGFQKANLYQFGLSPIDDVAAITGKAWAEGYRNALLLVPDNAQGQRIAAYFNSAWQDLGGNIVETQTYKLKESDFSGPIAKLLNLDESEGEAKQASQQAPELTDMPRARQDADVIFLNAASAEARSMVPQLYFYQQETRLPVYATSAVYSGLVNQSLDSDLNRVTFCDTPWLLDKSYQGPLSQDALQEAWQTLPHSYLRLFAMGVDAYQLITRLNTLEVASYGGASGLLSLTAESRVQRTLVCARFNNGAPELIDSMAGSSGIEGGEPTTTIDVQAMPEGMPRKDLAE